MNAKNRKKTTEKNSGGRLVTIISKPIDPLDSRRDEPMPQFALTPEQGAEIIRDCAKISRACVILNGHVKAALWGP